jgi:uncharacterized membrane protein YkvA (DUF1232 family)
MNPLTKSLMVVGAALYVICPLDFDFIPVFGWIDDAIVIWMTYRKLQADKLQEGG